MDVLVIIPCFNEGQNLRNTVENLKACVPGIDFVVINDGSQDDTYQVCVDNDYPVANLPFNLGLASAVQTGMRYAYNKGYGMALQFDGDGQHQPEYISGMVQLMRETSSDIVIGSRYKFESNTVSTGKETGPCSLSLSKIAKTEYGHMDKALRGLRGLGIWFIRIAVKVATGKTLTDPTSGMRLFNRRMIEKFATRMNYGPEPDTLAYLIRQGAAVIEMPVTMQERKAGKSYLGVFPAINYMFHMFVSVFIIQWFRGKHI